MWKTAFKKFEGVWSALGFYPLKFFKGCLPQILLGPFLNTLSHLIHAQMVFIFSEYYNLPV